MGIIVTQKSFVPSSHWRMSDKTFLEIYSLKDKGERCVEATEVTVNSMVHQSDFLCKNRSKIVVLRIIPTAVVKTINNDRFYSENNGIICGLYRAKFE